MAKATKGKKKEIAESGEETNIEKGFIEVFGAREHNLKNIDISIPKNKLVVFTGVSGSGKSSLAFDTIYNEGQRRYMESFSAYARQFMGDMERPDVDKITGLSPVISIEQKTTGKNPRSTVGTVTEIYDFLRLLYARTGEAYSYNTGKKMVKFSEDEIVDNIYARFLNEKVAILAPLVRGRKGHYRELFEEIRKKGFLKVRVDGEVLDIDPKMQLDRYKVHDIEVVIDRLPVTPDVRYRVAQSVQAALKMGKDLMFVSPLVLEDNPLPAKKLSKKNKTPLADAVYSRQLMCVDTGISYEEPSPNSFSFNSPYGYCPACKGMGSKHTISLDAVVPDPSKSIKEGGIAPIGEKREAQTYKQAEQFAKKNKIPIDKPIQALSPGAMEMMLYGKTREATDIGTEENESEPEELDFSESSTYKGVIPMLNHWFKSATISESMREWVEKFMELVPCPKCDGDRLRKESLWFKIAGLNIAEICHMDLDLLQKWFEGIESKMDNKQQIVAKDILKEIRERLGFLLDVGLAYLSIDRPSRTLSGGESQRIRLATQIGSQLQGITYILDEPSIGLHQRDNQRLISALENLRDIGNSVIVVEHDKDIMMAADHLVDIGPKAGRFGGTIVAQGTPKEVLASDSSTAAYLKGDKGLLLPKERRSGNGNFLRLEGVVGNNLQGMDVSFPLGKLIVVSGVSGSGKSTLINETLYPILSKHCYGSKTSPMQFKSVSGLEHIDKVIEIDQSPIGRTPRSNPSTYCGFFTEIRTLFASVPEAKIRGYAVGRFSFNVKGGRCEVCEGGGMKVIEMNFLPDVYVQCEKCNGRRYNRETLEIRYKSKSISDVLDMTVDEATEFFQAVPWLYRKIKVLQDVGLGYITLGQSAVTLSGGEAQRVKLSTELGKRDTGKTFYILDEPTTGLHFQDIQLLMNVVDKLVDRGNTVLIIEHNLDVVKMADHIIDIGPEGGNGGGNLVFEGTPEAMIANPIGHTAKYLKIEMDASKRAL